MDKPKILDQVRDAIRVKHYSMSTEEAYVHWIKRFILFHEKRHPLHMGEPEVSKFLSNLAVEGKVSASTQNQALSAILFIYQEVLKQELGWINNVKRVKKPSHLPVVFTKEEAKAVLLRLEGTKWITTSLLYGAGLRLMECLGIRVKDIDFSYNQIVVRDGKGGKDWLTMLPESLKEPLKKHLEKVRILHEQDLKEGFGNVYLDVSVKIAGGFESGVTGHLNVTKNMGQCYVSFPDSSRISFVRNLKFRNTLVF